MDNLFKISYSKNARERIKGMRHWFGKIFKTRASTKISKSSFKCMEYFDEIERLREECHHSKVRKDAVLYISCIEKKPFLLKGVTKEFLGYTLFEGDVVLLIKGMSISDCEIFEMFNGHLCKIEGSQHEEVLYVSKIESLDSPELCWSLGEWCK
jgi:hypothetical protein